MDRTKYSDYGRMMTGFSSGNERSFYGHWKNPEYQEQEMFTKLPTKNETFLFYFLWKEIKI